MSITGTIRTGTAWLRQAGAGRRARHRGAPQASEQLGEGVVVPGTTLLAAAGKVPSLPTTRATSGSDDALDCLREALVGLAAVSFPERLSEHGQRTGSRVPPQCCPYSLGIRIVLGLQLPCETLVRVEIHLSGWTWRWMWRGGMLSWPA
mmetsp:Transcript_23248/g.65024  ORF Transcript_23248/g.65024 Transcript_23248/m.65024 type:complete len:149 (-) Transcript_23248:192-638(-)